MSRVMNRVLGIAIVAAFAFASLTLPRTASSAGSPSTAAGTLRAAPAMSSARAAHTMTALDNGDVLIVGGFTAGEEVPAGAESFDARSGRFSATGQPKLPRQSHSATRLKNGTILIAGGLIAGNRYTNSAEIYDPATKTFRTTGSMAVARSGQEAVLLDDGRVLMAGGIGEGWTFLSSAEIYDPRTERFAPTGSMARTRAAHAAVKLRDGRVLVVGGHRGRGEGEVVDRTAEIYDPRTGRFVMTGSMVSPRHKHDAVTLDDGRVLILGGSDKRDDKGMYSSVELYEPGTGRFRPAPPMQQSRHKLRGTALVLPNGVVIVAGGSTRVERYEVRSGTSVVVNQDAHRAGPYAAAVAPLPGGRALITGGYGHEGRGPSSEVWIYDPARPQG